jgi:predicted MFS family arabinose efflux permease
MIFSYLILPESFKRSVLDENKDNKMSMLSPLKAPIAIFFIMTFIISLVMAAFQGSIAYFTMDRFGLADIPSPIPLVFFLESDISLSGPGSMAVICTVMGLMSAICQGFLVNKLINKFSEEKTIFYGLALSAVGLALFLISADFLSLVIFSGIFSIGSGLVTPCINAIISNRTDQSRQGAIMGFVGSYNGLGRIIGPPAGGFLYDINIFIPYLLTAVISAFSAIAVYVFIKKDKKAIIEQEIKILK